MSVILESDLPLKDKIDRFAVGYSEQLIDRPHLPSFIIHELNNDPKILVNLIKGEMKFTPMKFIEQIEKEIEAGNIKAIEPKEVVVNLMSLVIFPFIAQPIITKMLDIDDYSEFIKQRAKNIHEQLLNGVLK